MLLGFTKDRALMYALGFGRRIKVMKLQGSLTAVVSAPLTCAAEKSEDASLEFCNRHLVRNIA
jgi:hypothetical protein